MSGRFIVIEGIDGTGKTTLVEALATELRAAGREVVVSYEPTRGPIGSRIRALAVSGRESVSVEAEIQLFIDDRTVHQREVILPALAADRDVLLDRYFYSSMAYQGARGGDVRDIERRNRAIAREPDLLVILELPVDEALRRITHKRGSAPDLFEGREYLTKVEAIFQTIQHPRLLRLDARQATARLVQQILTRLQAEPALRRDQ